MDNDTRNTSDESIAGEVANGNTEVFGVLVDRYEKKLLRYGRKFLARREDVEDMVQNVFLNAYQNIKSFDTTLKFSSWIYRIAHNTFVNAIRSKRDYLSIDFDTILMHPLYEDPDVNEREQKEMREMIDKVLKDIPPKYREVLVLHYFEDMAYKDISEILKIPVGTVGIRLKRGKDALKDKMNKKEI